MNARACGNGTRRPGGVRTTHDVRGYGTALGLACAVLLVACGGGEPGAQRSAIFGGHPAPADTSIVALTPGCTGTLIAPNVVLTAHHCVAKVNLVMDCTQCTYDAPRAVAVFSVATAPMIDFGQRGPHAVTEVLPLPEQADPQRLCGDDLALVVLSAPVAAEEAVPVVPRVDEPPVRGEAFSAIGFGREDSAEPSPVTRTRNRRDGVTVQCVGAECPADFNNVQSREWVGQDESCAGDSGGTALDAVGRLIGVHNRGANVMAGQPDTACSGTSIYNQVFPHAAWLKSEVARVSMAAGLAPPPWSTGYPTDPRYAFAIGAACGGPADCPSGHCVEGVCSRACSAAASCPMGFSCEATSELCTPIREAGCSLSVPEDPVPGNAAAVGVLLLLALGLTRSARARVRHRR